MVMSLALVGNWCLLDVLGRLPRHCELVRGLSLLVDEDASVVVGAFFVICVGLVCAVGVSRLSRMSFLLVEDALVVVAVSL